MASPENSFLLAYTDTIITPSLKQQTQLTFPTYKKMLKAMIQDIHHDVISYQNQPGQRHQKIEQIQSLKRDILSVPFQEMNQYLIGCQIYERRPEI